MKVRNPDNWLWIAAVLSFAISLTRWGPLVLYPFRMFSTWVHECGHAVMTLLVGGGVSSIVIEPNGAGLTKSLVPQSRIAQGLVASAGYLSASIVGCALMIAARGKKQAHAILWTIGAFMLLTLIIWMRNLFGIVVVLIWSLALIALSRRASGRVSSFVLSLLAVQVALNSIFDIRVLFLVNGGHSDADTMARLFVLPGWTWASLWMLISVGLLTVTLLRTR
ncbi:MAG TPA: M50 family metallopeptidase [Vicinamibacterales bacterium]|jgi:peptidase M50B-like protein|nr:M50 family metallopeptidase [Vicinamibacterales bacterium]